jgi:copper chaperone CopZ
VIGGSRWCCVPPWRAVLPGHCPGAAPAPYGVAAGDSDTTAFEGRLSSIRRWLREGEMALTMCVPGLTCRHAVRVVSARLRDVPGVESVEVDGPAGWVVVRGAVDAQQVRAALVEAGYPPEPLSG